jgi:hypothetical protein
VITSRRLSYSICLATVITAASYVLHDRGGEFVLWPGLVSQVMFNGILLAIPSGDHYYSLPSGSYLVFNVAFYASIIFAAVSCWFVYFVDRFNETENTIHEITRNTRKPRLS